MIELKAWQYVYGYGKSGFETLGYSKAGLSQDQVFEIQSRVAPRGKLVEAGRRWEFFRLQDGRSVFVQAVPRGERDSSYRGGAFVAHGFVLSKESFREIEFNPFAVFSTAPFISTQDKLLGEIAPDRNIPATALQIPPNRAQSVVIEQAWTAEQLLDLANLALCAEALRDRNTSVAFVGPFIDTIRTLSTVTMLLPPDRRSLLSFNTSFDGCNPVGNYFWGVGFAERPTETRYLVVDTASHDIGGSASGGAKFEGPYANWLRQVVTDRGPLEAVRWSKPAWLLHRLLEQDQGALSSAGEVDLQFAACFLDLNRPAVDNLVESAVRAQVPAVLLSAVCAGVERRYTHDLAKLQAALNGFPGDQLADIVFEHFTELSPSQVSKAEGRAVGKLAKSTANAKLRALAAAWHQDLRQLAHAGAQIACTDYCRVAAHALRDRILSVSELLVPGQAACLLAALSSNLPASQVLEVCRVLIRQGQTDALKHLASRLAYMRSLDLVRLERLVRDVAVPIAFQTALNATRERAARNRPDLLGTLHSFLSARRQKQEEDLDESL